MTWRFPSGLKWFCISMELLRNLISSHAHGFYHGILNTHGFPSNGRPPMNAITLPEIFRSTNKPVYFNIEQNSFKYVPPFTIPKNTRKFAAYTTRILNVVNFVDSPPTSACHFSIFSKTPALSLLAQKVSQMLSAWTNPYSPSPQISADLT